MILLLGILILVVPTLSGIACSYLAEPECTPGWRVPTGVVLGIAGISLVVFVFASLLGLTTVTLLLSVLITGLPLLALRLTSIRARIQSDLTAFRSAAGSLIAGKLDSDANSNLIYAIAASSLLLTFFARAAYFQPDGIYTGDQANFGDLPFHFGIISGFVQGGNFPPQHPELAGARLTYHFLADLYAALLIKGGFTLQAAFEIENALLALSLLALLHRFAWTMTRDRLTTLLSPAITLLSGGLGFELLTANARDKDEGILQLIWHPVQSYTMSVPQQKDLWWGNMLTTQLMTQRPLLLGIPLLLIVCILLHQVLEASSDTPVSTRRAKLIASGLIAGIMPLAHIFCFAAVLATAGVAWVTTLIRGQHKAFDYIYLFGPALLIALPQLLWLTHNVSPIGIGPSTFRPTWHVGWMADSGENLAVFWLRNCGPFIPLLICAFALVDVRHLLPKSSLILAIPFIAFFVAVNLFQLSPWLWDNSKLLVIWYVGTAPLAALALTTAARLGTRPWGAVTAVALGGALMLSGAIDVWGVMRVVNPQRIFNQGDMAMAASIEQIVPPNETILSAPSCFSPAILSGRRMLEGYPGHLWSQGFNYSSRDNDVRAIYSGAPNADQLLRQYGVRYVLVGPLERDSLTVNDSYFTQFRPVAVSGQETLYDTQTQ